MNSYDKSKSLEDRLTITIDSVQTLDEETAKELQQFTWKITAVSPNSMAIKVSFEHPESVSTESSPSFIQVKAEFSDFEPNWNDDLVLFSLQLPKQERELGETEIAEIEQADSLAQSGSTSIVSVIVFNILTSGAMAQIWGMINSMQIYAHFNLLDLTAIPNYSNSQINSILEISSFEIIPVGDILNLTLPVPDDDGKEVSEQAERVGFESYYTIMNLGTLFVTFLWILIGMPLILFLLRPCRYKSQALDKRLSSLQDALYGNLLLRYLIEAALDICICIVFQFMYTDLNGGMSMATVFTALNTIMTVILAMLVGLFIPFVLVFYLLKFKKWGEAKFVRRYGTVTDGLRKDRKSSLV